MTVAVLAEKPKQAREWAKALGGMKGVYEGEQYIIVHAIGHLYEFIKPGQPGSTIDPTDEPTFKSWDISKLPWDEKKLSWSRTYSSRVADQIKSLKADLKNVNEIAIATDLDPTGEGDLIAVEIIQELGYATGKKYSRVNFVDDSEASLRKAFSSREKIPDLFAHPSFKKAFYRTRFDYLTMQWTRMATDGTNGIMIKQGRLKTAMVKLIGDQLAAYNNYVRKPFYKSSFVDDNGVRYMDKDAPQYDKREDVPMDFHDSKVILDTREKKTTPPPALMTLSGLAAKLAPQGYKTDVVLAVYQRMYEDKLLSYPRTEDKHITTEQFNEMSHLVDQIAKVVGADIFKLTHRTPRGTHVKDKGAHGANRPGTRVPASLDDIENNKDYGKCGRAIYEMLAKNFLAMYAEDYVYEQQKGHVEDYPSFIGSANVPKSMGFKDIFNDDDEDVDEDEKPTGLGSLAKPEVFEGAPARPAYPTQKWLYARLDKDGIGTGATQGSTFAEVCKPEKRNRNDAKPDPDFVLVKDKRGKLSLGELGEFSYALTPGTRIGDLSLTKQIQDNMRAIADGTLDADEVLAGVAALVVEDMPIMARNAEEMKKTLTVPVRRSKSEIVKGTWNGKEIGIFRDVFDHKLTDDEIERAFAGEVIEFEATTPNSDGPKPCKMSIQEFEIKGEKRTGLRFVGKPKSAGGVPLEFCGYKFSDDEIARFEKGEKIKFGEVFTWPKSGNKGSATLFFDKKTKKLEFAKGVPATFCGHTFSDDEIKRLEAGEEVEFGEVFTWPKSGKTGSATLKYDKKQGRLVFADKKK